MSDPGGERQDPRVKVWVLLDRVGAAVGAALDVDTAREFRDSIPEARGWREFYVPASSVPVGGAPREKVADALYGHLGDFSTYEKCLELADAAIAAMRGAPLLDLTREDQRRAAGIARGALHRQKRGDTLSEGSLQPDDEALLARLEAFLVGGAPRDDQNDDVETLAEARGVKTAGMAQVTVVDNTLLPTRDEATALLRWLNGTTPVTWPEDVADGRLLDKARVKLARLAGEPGANSAAYPKPSDSGAAPKGGQEEERNRRIMAEAALGQARELIKVLKSGSPPPDRLTPSRPVFTDEELAFIGPVVHAHEAGLNESGQQLKESIKAKCLPFVEGGER